MRERTESHSEARTVRHPTHAALRRDHPSTLEGERVSVSRDPRLSVRASLEETAFQIPSLPKHAPEVPKRFHPTALIGKRLGEYRIESILGRGSMACVYKAEHMGLRRPCALKVMDPALVMKQPVIREQFWAEARVVANLLHPHIVTIHNLGSADGFHFIEMEYVPGGMTLRESLVREGPLEPVARPQLARAGRAGPGCRPRRRVLVHRDIKPANVLVPPRCRAKLADFGGRSPARRADTRRGAAGRDADVHGPRTLPAGRRQSAASNIHARASCLFHALSGRLPFTADTIGQLIRLHQHQAVPDVRADRRDAIPDAAGTRSR